MICVMEEDNEDTGRLLVEVESGLAHPETWRIYSSKFPRHDQSADEESPTSVKAGVDKCLKLLGDSFLPLTFVYMVQKFFTLSIENFCSSSLFALKLATDERSVTYRLHHARESVFVRRNINLELLSCSWQIT